MERELNFSCVKPVTVYTQSTKQGAQDVPWFASWLDRWFNSISKASKVCTAKRGEEEEEKEKEREREAQNASSGYKTLASR